jgi:hypothetical protein
MWVSEHFLLSGLVTVATPGGSCQLTSILTDLNLYIFQLKDVLESNYIRIYLYKHESRYIGTTENASTHFIVIKDSKEGVFM